MLKYLGWVHGTPENHSPSTNSQDSDRDRQDWNIDPGIPAPSDSAARSEGFAVDRAGLGSGLVPTAQSVSDSGQVRELSTAPPDVHTELVFSEGLAAGIEWDHSDQRRAAATSLEDSGGQNFPATPSSAMYRV